VEEIKAFFGLNKRQNKKEFDSNLQAFLIYS